MRGDIPRLVCSRGALFNAFLSVVPSTVLMSFDAAAGSATGSATVSDFGTSYQVSELVCTIDTDTRTYAHLARLPKSPTLLDETRLSGIPRQMAIQVRTKVDQPRLR